MFILILCSYLLGCRIISIPVWTLIMVIVYLICIIKLWMTNKKITKLISNKNNLNSFLQITIDRYIGMGEKRFPHKRRLNKQRTLAYHLMILLEKVNKDEKNKKLIEKRNQLHDFIDKELNVKNENKFIQLCQECLNYKNTSDNIATSDEENDSDNEIANKLILKFVFMNIKMVIFIFLILAFIVTLLLGYFPYLQEIDYIKERIDYINTTNTVMFDLATIMLLYFEIKQEEV